MSITWGYVIGAHDVPLDEHHRMSKTFRDADTLREWIKFYTDQETPWALGLSTAETYALFIIRDGER